MYLCRTSTTLERLSFKSTWALGVEGRVRIEGVLVSPRTSCVTKGVEIPTNLYWTFLKMYIKQCVRVLSHFSLVWLFVTLWTVAYQAPLSMGFSRQEYWSGLPCPPPGDLPDPGMKPASLRSPALVGRFFTTSATWETHIKQYIKANETGFQPFFFTPSVEAHSHTHTSYNTIW